MSAARSLSGCGITEKLHTSTLQNSLFNQLLTFENTKNHFSSPVELQTPFLHENAILLIIRIQILSCYILSGSSYVKLDLRSPLLECDWRGEDVNPGQSANTGNVHRRDLESRE